MSGPNVGSSGVESRRLSSRSTDFYRYGVAAFGVLWLLLVGSIVFSRGFEPENLLSSLAVVLLFAAMGLGYYWLIGRAQHVELRGDQLLVRGWGREALIPLRDVESVGGSRFTNPERMWLDLRVPGPFGSRIHFLPPQRFYHFFSLHPLVAELEQLVAIGSGSGPPPTASTVERPIAPLIALVLAAIGVFGVLVFALVIGILRSSDPYALALQAVQADPRSVELLGEPIETGWWALGSLKRQGAGGHAELHFPVRGPRREASVDVTATRIDGVWRLDRVQIESDDEHFEVEPASGPG